MNYLVLDTCTILHLLRGKELGAKILEVINGIANPTFIISAVTKAELNSMKIKLGWGGPRCKALNDFLDEITCIDIISSDEDLLNAYALIDSYSQRLNVDKKGLKLQGSSKNMGKNDLWIAATAYLLNCPLLTTDGDFLHLNKTIIEVILIK